MGALRVLYVHHAGPFGGASRSLFELLRNFPVGTVEPLVLTKRGQFQAILERSGIDVLACRGIAQFDNTRYSHYRGARWLILLRELFYLPLTLWGLLSARRRWGQVDIVHVNDLTLIPVIWLARRLFACPLVVHVRSVQRPLTDWRGRILLRLLRNCVDQFVAIDETVRRSLDDTLPVVVVHNGLTITSSDTASLQPKDEIFTIGMVGGLLRAKGCLEFVEAARICREQDLRARFVFVGQGMRRPAPLRDALLRLLGLSQEIEKELKDRIAGASLADCIEFWPFTLDLASVYRRLDVLCFPSHLDAPGRPIFEAAFFGVPSIAAISAPTPDTIVDGVTGLIIPPRQPERLADAILRLAREPQLRTAMGENARSLALKHFDICKNARAVLALYRQLASGDPGTFAVAQR